MTKEQLIKGLNECGVKKKDIELRLGMPKNSLSGMLSGSKPIPDKWFVLLEGFLGGNLAEVGSEINPKSEVVSLKQVVTPKVVNEARTEIENKTIATLPKASDIMLGADYLAELPKTTFQNLLIEFNSLVQDLPPISKVREDLVGLIDKAQHPDLNARQSEAIRARCIYYLNGMYSGQKTKN